MARILLHKSGSMKNPSIGKLRFQLTVNDCMFEELAVVFNDVVGLWFVSVSICACTRSVLLCSFS